MNTYAHPHIAINVMRARLTVVGFNIAIVSFQLSALFKMQGGILIPGFDHTIHFRADIALFLALALSLLALVAFISSAAINDKGVCDHWSFIAGDLFMYLGLACAVTGFLSPLNDAFLLSINSNPQLTPLTFFQTAINLIGALVWIATIYVGPAVTLLRSPFPKKSNWLLGCAYLITLLILFMFYHQALLLETLATGHSKTSMTPYLYEFFQPLIW